MVYLSQQGFGVFILDNRGSANRNHAFSRAFYKRFADIEVKDQLAGARALEKISWVDTSRPAFGAGVMVAP
jgi:dipeptidyl-peptidase-4